MPEDDKPKGLLKIEEFQWSGITFYRCPVPEPCTKVANRNHPDRLKDKFSSSKKSDVKDHMWKRHFAHVQAHIEAQRLALKPLVPLFDAEGKPVESIADLPVEVQELEASLKDFQKQMEKKES